MTYCNCIDPVCGNCEEFIRPAHERPIQLFQQAKDGAYAQGYEHGLLEGHRRLLVSLKAEYERNPEIFPLLLK